MTETMKKHDFRPEGCSLHDNGQPDLVRQIIAKRIIEVARKGERDPDELCARALRALGFRIRQIA
jgi:hypothetical protein